MRKKDADRVIEEYIKLIYGFAMNKTRNNRLGFAKITDKIVVFNEGNIAEEGLHKDLLKQDGIYANMYKNQESWYVA